MSLDTPTRVIFEHSVLLALHDAPISCTFPEAVLESVVSLKIPTRLLSPEGGTYKQDQGAYSCSSRET